MNTTTSGRLDVTDTATIDVLAERLAAKLPEHQPEGFLDVDAAAEFLSCPKSRVYKLVSLGRLPHHKDGSRTLFVRAELREYVRNGGATTCE